MTRIKFIKPVYPDDVLHTDVEILDVLTMDMDLERNIPNNIGMFFYSCIFL